jgi:hypothetical protein
MHQPMRSKFKYKAAQFLSSKIAMLMSDDRAMSVEAHFHHIEKTRHELQHEIDRLGHDLHQIKQTLNLTSQKMSPGRRIKCLFLVHFIHSWDALADLYELMQKDSEFEPIVASLHRRYPNHETFYGEALVHEGLEKLGIPHIRLPMEDSFVALDIIKAIAPDIIFRQTPWDADIQPAFYAQELRFARLCYIPYYGLQITESHTNEQKGGEDFHINCFFHQSCWRIFCEHEFIKNKYAELSPLAGRNVVVTGHTKLTRLERLSHGKGFWPINRTLPNNKTAYKIIWAPHHSINKDWLNFGNFPRMMDDMLAWAQKDQNIDFVLKPHPLLFESIGAPNSPLAPEALDDFLTQWKALPNTAISEAGHYAPLFAASDVLITGGISFLIEYQLFGKPVIFTERPDHVPFNELGEWVVQGVNRVTNVEQTQELVEQLRAGAHNPRQQQSQAIVEQLVPKDDPAVLILENIRSGIRNETCRFTQ